MVRPLVRTTREVVADVIIECARVTPTVGVMGVVYKWSQLA